MATPRTLTPHPPLLQLWLGVAEEGLGVDRWLWRTQVLDPDGTPSRTEGVAIGSPRLLKAAEDQPILTQALGRPCVAGVVAQVPRSLIPQMRLAMHVALAAHLRDRGDLKGAQAVERPVALWRHPPTPKLT